MNVDLVVPRFHPAVGGIEDHVAGLARRWIHHGHKPTVHTLTGPGLTDRDSLDGIGIRRYTPRVSLGYYTTRFEPDLAGDLVHLHGYGMWTNDWVAAQARPKAKVLTLHHGLRIPTSNPIKRLYHWWHGRGAARRTLERMDAVIAITQLDMQRLAALRFPMDRAHLIPNGVPADAFAATEPFRPPEGWDGYFLFLGRLHAEKEPVEAVRALASLPSGVGMILAGPDEGEAERIRSEARRLGLAARIRLMGRVDLPEKTRLLAGARGLVLPSRYEAQGRVILEAWAQGLPVVASAVGGVPFLVRDGEDGLLHGWRDTHALAKALETLWHDPRFAAGLGEAGRRRAKAEFSEEKLYDQALQVCLAATRAR